MENEEKNPQPQEGKDTSAQVVVEETAEAKATRLQVELEQWKKESKAHQSNFTKANQELKRLREQPPRSDGTNKAVLDILKEQFGDDPRITNLQATLTREEQIARQDILVQDARTKLEQKIEGAGLNAEDERLDTVWDSFDFATNIDGKFERADKRLDRILSKVAPKKEAKKEEVNEEEIARRWMEKKGLLGTDIGSPSGANASYEQTRDAFIKDPRDLDTRERYLEMRRKRKR